MKTLFQTFVLVLMIGFPMELASRWQHLDYYGTILWSLGWGLIIWPVWFYIWHLEDKIKELKQTNHNLVHK